MPVQSADANTRAARDFFKSYACANLGECRFRGINEQQAIAGTICARFSRRGDGLGFGVDRIAP
jgi:hypothetical protein